MYEISFLSWNQVLKTKVEISFGGCSEGIPEHGAPIKNGIDKSRPPNITTNVCPIVASPKKEAKTNIDLIFCNDKKPSIETDPITT